MRNLGIFLIIAAGCWYLWSHYELKGLERLLPSWGPTPASPSPTLPPVPPGRRSLRILSFNANPLQEAKLNHPGRLEALVRLCRGFDIIALQNIQTDRPACLRQLRDQLNVGGRYYEVALASEGRWPPGRPMSAFVYDRATVEIDLSKLCWLEDSKGRLYERPLVGVFRARGVHPSEAFTFALVAVSFRPQAPSDNVALLEQLYQTVGKQYPGEDDIILVGTLYVPWTPLEQWAQKSDVAWALGCSELGWTEGTLCSDNIVFPLRATVEYTGRSGRVDLVQELGLGVQDAMEFSDHSPIWAEFSIYEGGQ